MFFPLGTDRPLKRPTVVTYWLIGLNVALYVFGAVVDSPRVSPELWAQVRSLLWLDPNAPRWWQFVTYQFVHAGFWHILFNMLFLYVFGPAVEDRLRRWGFLAFYLVGGAFAGAAHALLEAPIPGTGGYVPPVVGASGSIAAVTGAFLVLFPLTNIRLITVFFVIGSFSIPSWIVIGFAIAKDLLLQGFGAGAGVALLAHLGGYAYGAGVALFLLWRKILDREVYDLFSMGRQLHRRRQFRELVSQGNAAWTGDLGKNSKVVRDETRQAKKEEERERLLAERRGEVTRLIARGEMEPAAEAYRALLNEFGQTAVAAQPQLDLANWCFANGRHSLAASAYEAFLKRHPSDRQTDHVRLMLALLNARYLNDPLRAQALIDDLRKSGVPADQADMVSELEKEIA